VKLTVVGHAVIDYIVVDGIPVKPTLGGTVTYTSIAASKLGLSVRVISKVGSDFPEDFKRFLESSGVNLKHLHMDVYERTTSYLIKYTAKGRRMWLRSRCSPITLLDLDEFEDSDMIHLGPVACELDQTVITGVLESGIPTSLDIQGLLRRFARNGYVMLTKNYDISHLKGLKLVKLSLREAEVLVGSNSIDRIFAKLSGISEIVAITAGGKGVYVASGSDVFHIPAYRTRVGGSDRWG
jgi:sugar/nucleoside kinase (ribokinase family)